MKLIKHATNRLFVFLPTVIVCCHGNAGIAQARLLRQDHLWHSGHIDDVGTPLAEHQALRPRGEPWPLDSKHSPSHVALDPQAARHLHQNLRQDRTGLYQQVCQWLFNTVLFQQ